MSASAPDGPEPSRRTMGTRGRPANNRQELANSITESMRRLRREYAHDSVLIDTASPLWPTSIILAASLLSGRAARGSVAPRKMACHQPRGRQVLGSRPSTRARRGSLVAAPLLTAAGWLH